MKRSSHLIRLIIINLLLLIFVGGVHAQSSFKAVNKPATFKPGQNSPFGYWEYLPDGYNSSSKDWPLIVFLPGLGEKGNGTTELSRLLSNGPPKLIKNGKDFPFLIMSPQSWNGWWDADILIYFLDELEKRTGLIVTGYISPDLAPEG
ncbi:MAG: hypothetical protein HC819_05115 [Cyclobacteriaceae bacterium]|nr:hypothetical protein [Cyclobacteriaceae bacterium]